jgi:5-methylcytosine-specific restriction endonuclease McrA
VSACRECGASFERSLKAGNQPQFCSLQCRKSYRARYVKAWTDKNRETVLADMAVRRQKHKELNPDYWRKHYAANREKRKEHRRVWYQANRDRALAAMKAWDARNPESVRRLGRKSRAVRRARLKDSFVEPVDALVIFERDKGICGICKLSVERDSDWHVDHVVPLAKGGEHSYANTQLAHGSCNRAKGARSPPQLDG